MLRSDPQQFMRCKYSPYFRTRRHQVIMLKCHPSGLIFLTLLVAYVTSSERIPGIDEFPYVTSLTVASRSDVPRPNPKPSTAYGLLTSALPSG